MPEINDKHRAVLEEFGSHLKTFDHPDDFAGLEVELLLALRTREKNVLDKHNRQLELSLEKLGVDLHRQLELQNNIRKFLGLESVDRAEAFTMIRKKYRDLSSISDQNLAMIFVPSMDLAELIRSANSYWKGPWGILLKDTDTSFNKKTSGNEDVILLPSDQNQFEFMTLGEFLIFKMTIISRPEDKSPLMGTNFLDIPLSGFIFKDYEIDYDNYTTRYTIRNHK